MEWVRSVRVRFAMAALVSLALVLQALAYGKHHGAMAAHQAETLSVAASLSDLGLTLADLPCHAANPDGSSDSGSKSKIKCPVCTSHGTLAVAVLPDHVAPVPPQVIASDLRPELKAVIAGRLNAQARARAPPAIA